MLSEHNHVDNMGDYEALVIVQAAGFTEGEVILYERLNMVPMLLEEYAKSGTDRARRQMLAMCEQHDPEIFAEVLSHFVTMANERLKGVRLFSIVCTHNCRAHLRMKQVLILNQKLVVYCMIFTNPWSWQWTTGSCLL